jgi:drug/metabolite transporter (DMT)-like permease
MISILLGLLAAFCWSVHDLLARRFAGQSGPFRMSFWILLAGAALLLVPVLMRGQIWQAPVQSILLALAMGLVYAAALGGLLKAFSLAPVSIVGPLTAGYPALVVLWGILNGSVPGLLQWAGIVAILTGVIVVARAGHDDGGADAVQTGKMPVVIASAIVASLAFAATVIMGQAATIGLGEYEVTFLSRFPAAAVLTFMMMKDRNTLPALPQNVWLSVFAMAACDVIAVTAINASAWFPNKELGAMAISSYGAMSVLLAMLLLKERVTALQWLGIALVVAGLVALSVW